MEECAYLDERLPRFDSSNIHSWFPVSQRLQRIPALGSQRIFKRRQTVQALCVVCVNGGMRREGQFRGIQTYRAPLVDFGLSSLDSGASPGLALSSSSSSLRTFFLAGPGAPAEWTRFRFEFLESAGGPSRRTGET